LLKPPAEGAGRGIRIARTFVELPDAIGDMIEMYGAVLVEEYIRGEEASVGLISHFRNEELYALPPAHISHGEAFLSPSLHESGAFTHTVPSHFTHAQKLSLADVARRAHGALGLGHFSRADFLVTPSRIYLLEVNTVPGLYPGASFPGMLEAVGSSVREFLEHSIHLARALS
jgi:D-alanine-D-alanine ligase